MDLTPGPSQDQKRQRQVAYEAVYEVIRQHPPRSSDDYGRAAENARVWRAVRAAIDAIWPLAYRAGREDAAEAVWDKAVELRGKPFRRGDVGIEYVNGMEDASEIARGQHPRTPGEDVTP